MVSIGTKRLGYIHFCKSRYWVGVFAGGWSLFIEYIRGGTCHPLILESRSKEPGQLWIPGWLWIDLGTPFWKKEGA